MPCEYAHRFRAVPLRLSKILGMWLPRSGSALTRFPASERVGARASFQSCKAHGHSQEDLQLVAHIIQRLLLRTGIIYRRRESNLVADLCEELLVYLGVIAEIGHMLQMILWNAAHHHCTVLPAALAPGLKVPGYIPSLAGSLWLQGKHLLEIISLVRQPSKLSLGELQRMLTSQQTLEVVTPQMQH